MLQKDVLKLDLTELYDKLDSGPAGLSEKEASLRLEKYGLNTFRQNNVNALGILARQLQSSLVYMLVVACIIAYWIRDVSDGSVIFAILLLNTLLGFFQEYKSEKIIEKLSQYISREVHVRRDNAELLLDTAQLVPGDVVTLREGDIAPADMRLLEADNLQINEAQLTGESLPVSKRVVPKTVKAETGMVYAGSIVEKGEGTGIVYATGMDTQFGNIAALSLQTKKNTAYEKSLQSFSTFLMKIVVFGLLLVLVFKLILNHGFSNVSSALLFVIAMAVAVVPEVLPVIATVSLSTGALKLAKKHVVVKRLSSLEDLGNVTLLCTDKTGTITENKMVINLIHSPNEKLFQKFAYAAITPLKGRKRRAQNSYDDAFLNYVSQAVKYESRTFAIIKELPFDPDDRRRRVVLEDRAGQKFYLVVMGAPEVLLQITHDPHKAEYLRQISDEGHQGLHHLALAYKEIKYKEDFDILKNEKSLDFLGYVGLHDPLRPTVKNTVRLAESLGIKIKILTGDSREAAEYVGNEINLLKAGEKVYIGSELDKMSESQFKKAVQDGSVFARVSPAQKYAIIKVLKENNAVAYQGDGINDAPALKLADVAIAVNSATDIAKENADIVLLNKSLEAIINGIKYGRSIFININKYIKYTMISNFGNFIALGALFLMSSVLPMLPIQLLLVNLITDIPLVTISSDSVEDADVVRPEKHNVRELILFSIILGFPTALFELFYFVSLGHSDPSRLQTSLYVFSVFLALAVFYFVRNKDFFWKGKAPSMPINVAFVAAFVFSLALIYIPLFQALFSFVPLPVSAVAVIILLIVVYFFAADLIKVWYYRLLAKE